MFQTFKSIKRWLTQKLMLICFVLYICSIHLHGRTSVWSYHYNCYRVSSAQIQYDWGYHWRQVVLYVWYVAAPRDLYHSAQSDLENRGYTLWKLAGKEGAHQQDNLLLFLRWQYCIRPPSPAIFIFVMLPPLFLENFYLGLPFLPFKLSGHPSSTPTLLNAIAMSKIPHFVIRH